MPEGVQDYESGQNVHWRISWKSKLNGETITMVRRSPDKAIDLAIAQRNAGFKTKLYRVEETELDF